MNTDTHLDRRALLAGAAVATIGATDEVLAFVRPTATRGPIEAMWPEHLRLEAESDAAAARAIAAEESGLSAAEAEEARAVLAANAHRTAMLAVEATTFRELAFQAVLFKDDWRQREAERVLERLVEMTGVVPYRGPNAGTPPATDDGPRPDAELLALREPYERTLAGIEAVSPAHSKAEDAYFDLKAAHPKLDKRTLRKRSGLVLAERAYVRALRRNSEVIHTITATPALTLAGAIFKAGVSHRESNSNPDLVDAIVGDLLKMEA